MITHQSIGVCVAPAVAYALAQDVARWPAILEHYSSVRVLSETPEERIAVMTAWRSWIPVRWTAAQRLLPAIPRIEFTHVAGWARGMRVAWIFDPVPTGTRIVITHDLSVLAVPVVRSRLGKTIVTRHFIAPIASRTLAGMKTALEAGRG